MWDSHPLPFSTLRSTNRDIFRLKPQTHASGKFLSKRRFASTPKTMRREKEKFLLVTVTKLAYSTNTSAIWTMSPSLQSCARTTSCPFCSTFSPTRAMVCPFGPSLSKDLISVTKNDLSVLSMVSKSTALYHQSSAKTSTWAYTTTYILSTCLRISIYSLLMQLNSRYWQRSKITYSPQSCSQETVSTYQVFTGYSSVRSLGQLC